MPCKYMVKSKWQDSTYCGCMVERGISPNYPQPSRQLNMYVTGSENWQAGTGNNWHLCVGGKHRVVGVTPSQACKIYDKGTAQDAALAKKYRPPKQPKSTPDKKSANPKQSPSSRSNAASSAAYSSTGRTKSTLHPETTPATGMVGKIVLAAIGIAVITVIGVLVMEFGGQSDSVSVPTKAIRKLQRLNQRRHH